MSGKWKLSRILTPFVTGPEDRKSTRIIGTVFNVLYCLSIIIVCYLAYLNKGKTGQVITFFIFAVCGALVQAINIRWKRKAGRFSKIMGSEFPLSYTDHQNIYARTHLDDLWKDLEKLEK